MTLFGLIISAIATWQVIEIWRHSTLFAEWRAWLELFNNYLSNLLLCPWCLSVWVGFGFAGLALASDLTNSNIPLVPAFAFSISRLANWANDISHSYCRTPNTKWGLPDDDTGFTRQPADDNPDREPLAF